MTVYYKTRKKYDLTPRQMARYCNLPLSVYYKIEKGMKLEGSEKMFDKFIRNITIKKVEEMNEEEAVNLKLETINEESKMDEFFKNFDRTEYFKKFNIKNYNQLAELLGNKYKPETLMMYICNLKKGIKINKTIKEDLYDFFSDTNNVQTEEEMKKKITKKEVKKKVKEVTEDQIWYRQNLEKKLKDLLTKEFGDGQFIGSAKKLIDKYPEVNRADLSRAIHGIFPGAKLATQLRGIFEQYLVEEETVAPVIEVNEKVVAPVVEKSIRTVEIDTNEVTENTEDECSTKASPDLEKEYLIKENEVLKDIIKQLPNDVLLGLVIKMKLGE